MDVADYGKNRCESSNSSPSWRRRNSAVRKRERESRSRSPSVPVRTCYARDVDRRSSILYNNHSSRREDSGESYQSPQSSSKNPPHGRHYRGQNHDYPPRGSDIRSYCSRSERVNISSHSAGRPSVMTFGALIRSRKEQKQREDERLAVQQAAIASSEFNLARVGSSDRIRIKRERRGLDCDDNSGSGENTREASLYDAETTDESFHCRRSDIRRPKPTDHHCRQHILSSSPCDVNTLAEDRCKRRRPSVIDVRPVYRATLPPPPPVGTRLDSSDGCRRGPPHFDVAGRSDIPYGEVERGKFAVRVLHHNGDRGRDRYRIAGDVKHGGTSPSNCRGGLSAVAVDLFGSRSSAQTLPPPPPVGISSRQQRGPPASGECRTAKFTGLPRSGRLDGTTTLVRNKFHERTERDESVADADRRGCLSRTFSSCAGAKTGRTGKPAVSQRCQGSFRDERQHFSAESSFTSAVSPPQQWFRAALGVDVKPDVHDKHSDWDRREKRLEIDERSGRDEAGGRPSRTNSHRLDSYRFRCVSSSRGTRENDARRVQQENIGKSDDLRTSSLSASESNLGAQNVYGPESPWSSADDELESVANSTTTTRNSLANYDDAATADREVALLDAENGVHRLSERHALRRSRSVLNGLPLARSGAPMPVDCFDSLRNAGKVSSSSLTVGERCTLPPSASTRWSTRFGPTSPRSQGGGDGSTCRLRGNQQGDIDTSPSIENITASRRLPKRGGSESEGNCAAGFPHRKQLIRRNESSNISIDGQNVTDQMHMGNESITSHKPTIVNGRERSPVPGSTRSRRLQLTGSGNSAELNSKHASQHRADVHQREENQRRADNKSGDGSSPARNRRRSPLLILTSDGHPDRQATCVNFFDCRDDGVDIGIQKPQRQQHQFTVGRRSASHRSRSPCSRIPRLTDVEDENTCVHQHVHASSTRELPTAPEALLGQTSALAHQTVQSSAPLVTAIVEEESALVRFYSKITSDSFSMPYYSVKRIDHVDTLQSNQALRTRFRYDQAIANLSYCMRILELNSESIQPPISSPANATQLHSLVTLATAAASSASNATHRLGALIGRQQVRFKQLNSRIFTLESKASMLSSSIAFWRSLRDHMDQREFEVTGGSALTRISKLDRQTHVDELEHDGGSSQSGAAYIGVAVVP